LWLRLVDRSPAVDPELVDHALDEHLAAVREDLRDEDEMKDALRASARMKQRRAWWFVTCDIVERLGRAVQPWAVAVVAIAGLVELVAR
jgi:hypothetical protein